MKRVPINILLQLFMHDLYFQGLFTPFEIVSIRETNLGANQWLPGMVPLVFERDSSSDNTTNKSQQRQSAFYYQSEGSHFFGVTQDDSPRDLQRNDKSTTTSEPPPPGSQNTTVIYTRPPSNPTAPVSVPETLPTLAPPPPPTVRPTDRYKVQLNPMQIRTFVIDVKKK